MKNDKTLKTLKEAWGNLSSKEAAKELRKKSQMLGQQIAKLQAEREAVEAELRTLLGIKPVEPRDLYSGDGEGNGRWQQGRDGH